jgi:hypothetical protein
MKFSHWTLSLTSLPPGYLLDKGDENNRVFQERGY